MVKIAAILTAATCMLCLCLEDDGSFTMDAPVSIDFDDLYYEIDQDISGLSEDYQEENEEFVFFEDEPLP